MSESINENDCFEAIKAFVEMGGLYYVDENKCIITAKNDEPVGVTVNGKVRPIMIFHQNMLAEDCTILNPFVETIGASDERIWFHTMGSSVLSVAIYKVVRRIIELAATEGSEIPTTQMKVVGMVEVDEKTLKEFDKLAANDLFHLFYTKSKKKAQVQTDLYDEDYRKHNKMRKKTWATIEQLYELVLGTSNPSKAFEHVGKRVGMFECDARLHVIVKVAAAINKYVKMFIDRDLAPSKLKPHLAKLGEYQAACKWFAGTATKADETVAAAPPPFMMSPSGPAPTPAGTIPGHADTSAPARAPMTLPITPGSQVPTPTPPPPVVPNQRKSLPLPNQKTSGGPTAPQNLTPAQPMINGMMTPQQMVQQQQQMQQNMYGQPMMQQQPMMVQQQQMPQYGYPMQQQMPMVTGMNVQSIPQSAVSIADPARMVHY